MSQEEDKQKSCSAGKVFAGGLAATAIGVGLGAALYYFFGRDDHPEEPSTSYHRDEHTLDYDEESYSTIEINTTTDTSINSTASEYDDLDMSVSDVSDDSDVSHDSDISDDSVDRSSSDHFSSSSESSTDFEMSCDNYETSLSSDEDWEVHHEIPNITATVASGTWFGERIRQKFRNRQRAYTLEECAICFDVMLANEELMALKCTHNFHLKCITPWLQQHETCPVCRMKSG